MIKVRLNGRPYRCVSSYEEMNVKQYLRIIREWDQDKDIADRDYFKLLCILCDVDFSSFDKTIENDITIINAVGWVLTQPFEFSNTPPKALSIRGKTIDIPEDISELSIGQNIHLRRDYIDKSNQLEESIAIATAIYLQPIIEGQKFNIKRAERLAKEIEEMPINLIYPIGFFLLSRALKFGTPQGKTWLPNLDSLKRKLKRMWRDSLRFIGFTNTTIYH